jgi:transcriptional regulator with XRE-family HTH domain
MSLEKRIKYLRQQKWWSQMQLSKKLNTHQKQIAGYERGVHTPRVELLIKMAELFNISLDYFAFDNHESTMQIADRDLIQPVKEIDKLPEEDRTTIKAMLNTFITKNRFKQLTSDTAKF